MIPIRYTGGLRLAAAGYVSGFDTRSNICAGKVTGMGIAAVDFQSRCSDGMVVLRGYVDNTGGPVTVRYSPVVNGRIWRQPQDAESASFPADGHHYLEVKVLTLKTANPVLGFALIEPVAMASKTIQCPVCPATNH